jgi:ubiquitin carboxyl-terminal hydrolase L3
MKYEKHFIPLESDPEVFTNLIHDLGIPSSFKFIDILSLEADQLQNVRSENDNTIEALILAIPDCQAYTEQTVKDDLIPEGDIIWLKQTINNACGLYAILHCVCNMVDPKEFGKIS